MPSIAQELLPGEHDADRPDPEVNRALPLRYSNAQLLSLARAQVTGIEEHLHTRLAPVVNRLVWTLLGADQEHDDVTHDAFIQIFRNVCRLRDPERLEQWAARIAINTVRNEIRKRRLRRWVFWDPFEDPGPLYRTEDFEGRELLAHTYGVLRRLPADEQVILSLRLFQDGSLDELVSLLGCSRTTAKRRLAKARWRFARLARLDPLLQSWLERAPTALRGEDDE